MTFFCVQVIMYVVLSLSGYDNSTGAWPYQGLTASGRYADASTAACGPAYAFGTRFILPDGTVKACYDRGGAITNGHLDIWHASHDAALAFGRRSETVGVIMEICR